MQVAYLHKASGSMIAGDVFTHSYGSPAVLRLSPNGRHCGLEDCCSCWASIGTSEH